MVEYIGIKGFKSVVDAELPLGRLNVFVGANGAGKSNVLEAIGLLGSAISGRVDEAAFRFRGVRPGTPALFKTAFEGKEIPRLIRLEARAGDALYRVTLDNPIDSPSPQWRFSTETIEADGRHIGSRSPRGSKLIDSTGRRVAGIRPEQTQGIVPLARTLRPDGPARLLDALEQFAIYTPYTPILRGLMPESAPREPVGLNGGGLGGALKTLGQHSKRALIRLEREVLALVDWASGIHVRGRDAEGKRSVHFQDARMRRGRDILAAADASEGALYVLFLLMLMRHPSAPRFFAVDNIDTALHPRLARALVTRVQEAIQSDDEVGQLIVTTHNPMVLDALDLGDERIRLFVIARESGTGFTTVRRIAHSAALERSVARGRTLSQLWVEGTLGGVPALM